MSTGTNNTMMNPFAMFMNPFMMMFGLSGDPNNPQTQQQQQSSSSSSSLSSLCCLLLLILVGFMFMNRDSGRDDYY